MLMCIIPPNFRLIYEIEQERSHSYLVKKAYHEKFQSSRNVEKFAQQGHFK